MNCHLQVDRESSRFNGRDAYGVLEIKLLKTLSCFSPWVSIIRGEDGNISARYQLTQTQLERVKQFLMGSGPIPDRKSNLEGMTFPKDNAVIVIRVSLHLVAANARDAYRIKDPRMVCICQFSAVKYRKLD